MTLKLATDFREQPNPTRAINQTLRQLNYILESPGYCFHQTKKD